MEHFNPSIDLVSALILFGILQGAVLLHLFLTKPAGKSRVYLSLFIGIILAVALESFLNRSGYMIHTLFLLNISPPLILCLGPLIYHYTLTLEGRRIEFWSGMAHYLPGLLYMGYSFFFFLQPRAVRYNALINSFHKGYPLMDATAPFPTDPLHIQGLVVVEIMVAHLLVYALMGLIRIRAHKTPEIPATSRRWLYLLNGLGVAAALVIFLAEGGVINGHVFFRHPLPGSSSSVFGAIFTYSISIFLISDTGVFRPKDRPKYRKSALSDDLRKKQADKILGILSAEKPYMSESFSLSGLAEKAGLKPHHVSQVINEELSTSFFELTHRFRIREAQRLLKESGEDLKIEYLAYYVGYRSKSAFFNAFKKITGTTPARFQEECGCNSIFPDGEEPETGRNN